MVITYEPSRSASAGAGAGVAGALANVLITVGATGRAGAVFPMVREMTLPSTNPPHGGGEPDPLRQK
ncbi:hypothetical protein GCM10009529_14970 [Micropruina glycogenica]